MKSLVRFSVDDYDRMLEVGVFPQRPDQRTELIYGEIREVNPPNPPHEDSVDRLNYWSIDNSDREEIRVRIQNSLGISEFDSVPQPDVAWMAARDYRQRRPEPADVLLLIEVSDSSLRGDRTEKAELYAQAGIQDYWIVNLRDNCIEVNRKPKGDVTERITYESGDVVIPLAKPDVKLSVDFVLGLSDDSATKLTECRNSNPNARSSLSHHNTARLGSET